MTDSMVERVARALYARRPHYWPLYKNLTSSEYEPIPWEHCDPTILLAVCQDARAAIEAMLQSRGGMINRAAISLIQAGYIGGMVSEDIAENAKNAATIALSAILPPKDENLEIGNTPGFGIK